MDHTYCSSSQRVTWQVGHTDMSPSSQNPMARDSKSQSGDHAGRVVVVVDPAKVVRSTQAAQTEDGEASREIHRSLAQLRRLLTMKTRTHEIARRCYDDVPPCRERAPRCLVTAGGLAMVTASGFTPYFVPMISVGVSMSLLGMCYAGVAPCTPGEGVELVRLCCKINAERRDDLMRPSDIERRIDGLAVVERTLRRNAIAFEVREATPLPAVLAAIIGEYADVDPDPPAQEPASSHTTAPPQDQSMG
ncbi:MAG: hypothetical protein V4609_19615 [Pseudomonadota bacterium]